jgi:Fic family protein
MITLDTAIDRDVLRIRHDFLDMPALVLTAAQTARLHALSTARAKTVLETLEAEGFLISVPNGGYRRAGPPTGD